MIGKGRMNLHFRTFSFLKGLKKLLPSVFAVLLISLFLFQKTIDNEILCGDIGGVENTCPYSDSDHESDHICINCPCNSLFSARPEMSVPDIQISFLTVSVPRELFPFPAFSLRSYLFRPPKA